MLIAARDLVRRKRALSRAEIRVAMSGNLCRCTGYVGIISAIAQVMDACDAAAPGPPPAQPNPWLGPAPGPTGAPVTAEHPTRALEARARPGARAQPGREPIRVAVEATTLADGTNRLSESFELAHPRAAVWALMSDLQRVAGCLPGMSLDGPPHEERVTGSLAVRIGPITARFTGEGSVRQFPQDYRQIITAAGGDRLSDSRVKGSLECALFALADGNGERATRVAATISYALTGRLAQIGRSAIARDLARRLGEAFAANLDAELAGGTPRTGAPLGGGLLLLQLVADRLRALYAALAGLWRGAPKR